MAVEWEKANSMCIDLVAKVIHEYHPRLREARIGVLFRSTAGSRNGRLIIGQASTVSEKWNVVLGNVSRLDFIIWLAKDWWDDASVDQRNALVDHELCHCYFDEWKPKILGHDIEEFAEVIERHGLWRNDLVTVASAFQPWLLREGNGEVVALSPKGGKGSFAKRVLEDVAGQINHLLDDDEMTVTAEVH